MVLNIFPRPKKVTMAPDAEPQSALPEPSIEALDELEPKKRPTRRGSRGGRGRSKSADESAAEAPSDPGAAVIAASATDGNTQPAVRRTNRQRATSAAGSSHAAPAEGSDHAPDEASVVAGKAPRTTRTPKREAAPADTAEAPAGKAPTTQAAMLRAIEQQSHQIEQLIRLQEDAARGEVHTRPPLRRRRPASACSWTPRISNSPVTVSRPASTGKRSSTCSRETASWCVQLPTPPCMTTQG